MNSTHGTQDGTNNTRRGDCACFVFFGGCVQQDKIQGCFAQLCCANGYGDPRIAPFTNITHFDREAINDMTQIYLKDFKGNCMKNFKLTPNESIKYMLQHIMYLPPDISFDHYTKYKHSFLSLVILLGNFVERLQQKKIKKLEDIIVGSTNPVTTAICLLYIAKLK